jgi:hypothetical protein
METQGIPDSNLRSHESQSSSTINPSSASHEPPQPFWRRGFRSVARWAQDHKSEVIWAAIFAVIVAWILSPPQPRPYTIYVVADSRTESSAMAALESLERNSPSDALNLGDVPVQVKIEKLDSPEPSAAKAKADELINRPDTLLVIGHLPSSLVEQSLVSYFQSSPPVPLLSTTASAEDLLVTCRQHGNACFQDGWFAPLLQLSPTNKEQGLAAIRFAAQKKKKKFLIVTERDADQDDYTKDLIQAYHKAIDEQNKQLDSQHALKIVGNFTLHHLPDKAFLRKSQFDCVLYAGELEAAHGLLNIFPSPQPMVILSDSTLESRLSDNALNEFTPARFTYQTDASDYNNHTNVYGKDAYWIARQLIGDLNKRGGDWRYWTKSLLHFHTVNDARRNLVRIMQENSISRTWYRGYPYQEPGGGEVGATYVFDKGKRVDGMFHVWQLNTNADKPGSEMEDIDNWHPPKQAAGDRRPAALARNVKPIN